MKVKPCLKKYEEVSYDQKIEKHEFIVGDLVLLSNSRFCLFLGKLKSKWTGPFWVMKSISTWSIRAWEQGGNKVKCEEAKNEGLYGEN